jgi:two-component system, chemotaxis family, CheB/CheR fusion protein
MTRKPFNGSEQKKATGLFVVGIGASAGGMEAIHDLFDYMPANTGFAFVVIQHLSPDHKSLLAELLSKHTEMNVREAEHGMPVESNCIYVIPSKKLITINKGKIKLDEKLKSRVPNNTIDVFFESLAEECRSNAVGIVLSGTGTDGTKGIEAIKQRGGVVVVQDPLTASFDGMPNSAVNSGFADLILPPEIIGEELVEYVKETPLARSLNEMSKHNEAVLKDILADIQKVTRHDFAHYKRPTLFRRLAKRMTELGMSTLEEYREYLLRHEDELKTLGKEFLINVTKFLRDQEAFNCLRVEVIPEIVAKKKPDDTIKIWTVACSTGEEAYSVAMLFLEHLAVTQRTTQNLKIFATDIDTEALEIASRGLYAKSIARDVPSDLLKKYFIEEGEYYRVSPELRKHVVFANHDVLKDPPFSHLDLITCRNMFIYINAMLQRKILKKFHFALGLGSFMMLGPSENVGVLQDVVQEVNRKWKIYRCMTKTGVMDHELMMIPMDSKSFVSPGNSQLKNAAGNLSDIFRETLMEERKIAGIFIDKDFMIKQAIGNYKAFLNFPDDNFNFSLLKLVTADLSVALGVGVRKAITTNQKTLMRRVMLHEANGIRLVNIIVKPYIQTGEYRTPFLCVILEEEHEEPRMARTTVVGDSISSASRIDELERELIDTRENLQAVIEELETANEELQSSNEEMISTNEELQSTNEELQSLNEELHTVSAEHQAKIRELLELNDDLNNYFRTSDIGQILLDRKLVVRKFSPSVTKMVNLIDTDLGRSIEDITTNLRNIDLVADVKHVLRTNVTRDREVEISNNNYYLMRVSPYLRRDGAVDGVVITFVDATESKRLSSILEGVFQSSISGITAKRAVRNQAREIIDFEYVLVNSAAESFFGVKPGTLMGRSLMEAFPTFRNNRYFDIYKKVVETGETAQFEFYHDNVDRWFEVTVVKMMDGLVTTHTDISDRKNAAITIARSYEELKVATQRLLDSNAQLERSNFDLLQFASVASHDLKEPLRKIQAFGNILQSKVQDKLTGSEINYLNKMISASNRMQTLIEDVLTLSKLSNNGLTKEKVDLSKLIRRIAEDLEITIKEKNATIKVDYLPVIEAVPGQMRQLFQNLISNSLKFSGKNPPVITITQHAISTYEAESLNIPIQDFVCIHLSDNGIGFENQYSDKIFGVFQRLHGRNYEGTGIGLAIARKIVENHGGIITASAELNKGAVFSIYLPVAKSQFLDGYGGIRAELLARGLTFMDIDGSGSDGKTNTEL